MDVAASYFPCICFIELHSDGLWGSGLGSRRTERGRTCKGKSHWGEMSYMKCFFLDFSVFHMTASTSDQNCQLEKAHLILFLPY